ncbi:hypothetical protein F0562_002784 [Nyssa sinensis]|uniref:Reverse transcriptase Ty1/copia-type domain-containing protein n=1 Tax=Nyssa sinensis TaxID=561372 RepID=A0A5J5BXL2_9ASTE|nr:hypothetical protein F0562_002784 [Nyssa sinensis]
MSQPLGFVDKDNPSYVCKLRKAIYGLKQAPRAWYYELRTFLLQSGFQNSYADTSLFVFHADGHTMYLLVYVDDLILTGDNDAKVNQFIDILAQRFSIKDLGLLTYFLGVEVVPNQNGLLLPQRRYIMDLLTHTKMQDAKVVLTPIPTSPSLMLNSGSSLSNPTEYRQVVGSLQYLLITRPDIAFAVNKLSQYMHCPTTEHWSFVKRLLRYLVSTIDDGLQIYPDSSISLHAFSDSSLSLHAFSDADWAGDKDTFCSTSAYVIYLGKNPVSWSSKMQRTVARSSTEAEYRSVANTAAELNFICYLLSDLGITLPCCPVIYCDNIGATQLCSNPIFHSRMKHVAIDFHFIRDQVQTGALRVAHNSRELQESISTVEEQMESYNRGRQSSEHGAGMQVWDKVKGVGRELGLTFEGRTRDAANQKRMANMETFKSHRESRRRMLRFVVDEGHGGDSLISLCFLRLSFLSALSGIGMLY